MHDSRVGFGRWLTLTASAAALVFAVAQPVAAQGPVPIVVLGTDYFQTVGVATDNIPGIGPVGFVGNPINPATLGDTDTIVQRQADAIVNGASIPIQITALSLKSAAPVNIGGSFFDVFVTLDPANLANDTGTMTIHGTAAGGTWDSNLNVFFDAHFVGPTTFDVFSELQLSSTGATWGPTPSPLNFIKTGPDSEKAGDTSDQNANTHTGLINNVDQHEVDFWPGLVHQGPHPVDPSTPEPSTLAFGVIGLITGCCFARRRTRRA